MLGTRYHRLVDMVLLSQIGRNCEVYIDDMLAKTHEELKHVDNLKENFESIRKLTMRLNLDKCTFWVQACKFLGFMLTHQGIEANLDKCQVIIDMRSLTSVKEVQQLTGRLAILS